MHLLYSVVCLQLLPLTPDLESRFWSIVNADVYDYYFFVYDWLLQKSKTKIFLAVESDAVAGLMLIYDSHIAQLRGEAAAVEFMLKNLPLEATDVQVPIDCENLLSAKYSQYELKAHVTLMSLEKGNEQLTISHSPKKLGVADAPEITVLMHDAYPKLWGEITTEAVQALFLVKEAVWVGIRSKGKLAAFGYAMLTPKACHITWIATSPQHERRGYASSIASALIQQCLSVANSAVIYVMDDNTVAKHIYSKVGFRPYKSYVFLKAYR